MSLRLLAGAACFYDGLVGTTLFTWELDLAKSKTFYICNACGQRTPKWMGQCPSCGEWDSMNAAVEEKRPRAGLGQGSARPVAYRDIAPEAMQRFSSGFAELDRVLGGGFVPGSLLLFGGDPGIGKSTLMLQTAGALERSGKRALYVSGEESQAQVKMRGERLGLDAPELALMTETSVEALDQAIAEGGYDVVFIDSIQTMHVPELPSGAGSVAQVREATSRLLSLAKNRGATVVLIGHITKEGAIAGPKTLEHMVDGVFYFEGDKYHRLRLIRAQKNRFGPAHELGIFQMHSQGLCETPNPSKALLEQRPEACAGSVVAPCIEGTRPLMVEVQVLLSNSTYASPRRVAMGVDQHRLALIMAVLEKKAGCQLQGLDVFVNVVGGISIQEPAIDLPLALAIYSSFRNLPFAPELAVFGELGLAGEVRSVSQADLRVKECGNLGFHKIICPEANAAHVPKGLRAHGVKTLADALEQAL